MTPDRDTLYGCLRDVARDTPMAQAATFEDRRLNYSEPEPEVTTVAPALLAADVRPGDRRGLSDGAVARLSNQYGEVSVRIEITDEMLPGVVGHSHCCGHGTDSWKCANDDGGANTIVLLGYRADVVERISGATIMDGISVELSPI